MPWYKITELIWIHDDSLTISVNGKIASRALLFDSLSRLFTQFLLCHKYIILSN